MLSVGSIGHAALLFASTGSRGPELSHPLAAFQSTRPNRILAAGTVNVLAIMVQFQSDNDSLTSGNGQFLMSQGAGLDAPPHDKAYFENHLLFLKNYFGKVSGGKLNVNYVVLDSVITLPHQMKYYSSPKTGTLNANNLGLLYRDSWHAADSIYKNFDFSQFQCFVIFHAGSGRDIDFTSTLGYDPRPFDIPSLYLNAQSLRNMFGASYSGQPVDNGSFNIPNSIIMPESESYQIYDATGALQINLTLGTNGLLAASFGSYLGLPDLFDSQTGITGIGRFGLMDGQAIFAYGGIFPPEPSAWEKMYLGWVTPVEVSPSTATTYQLYANETGKYSVLKVPISGSEYFLIENRERDAEHNGENITTFYKGNYSTISFDDDTTYFDGTQIKGINGVVTDVDEYDWALPGDISNGIKYYGGILIWHIDDNVINQNIATNTVNANPDHRGVALMEAHGANQIGMLIQTFTGFYYYDGSAYDFWFKGNPAVVYTNQFTPTSLPNSNSYSGANSHVYITNFSGADSAMTFDVRVGDSNIQPTASFPKNIHDATVNSSPVFGHISADGRLQVIANNGDSLYAFNMDGTSAGFDSTGLFSKVGGAFQPIVSSENAASNTIYAMDDSVFYGLVDRDNNHDGTADTIFSTKSPSPNPRAGGPLLLLGSKILSFPSNYQAAWTAFTTSGKYLGFYSMPLPLHASGTGSSSAESASSILPRFAAIDTSRIYLNVPGYGVYSVNVDNVIQSSSNMPPLHPIPVGSIPIAISYASLSPERSPVIVELTSHFVYLDSTGSTPQKVFSVFPGDTITSGPVIADLDGDGNRDIIFATQTKVYAISYTGAVLNHFPITTVGSEVLPSDANRITGSVVVADLDGDGKPEVIFGTKGGEIYAFTGATGQILPGFPLSVGGALAGSPAVAYDPGGNLYLAAIGLDGYLYSWTFKGISPSQVVWGNLLHDNYHLNSVTQPLQSQPPPPAQNLMPTSQVYNWPNPVTNGLTKIHFYLRDNARVSISIFSFAGDKVADIQTSGTGGMANEVDWNASGVQSGVYFARVEAVSSKERDVAIIKIAVVK
ncbi:MAG: FG-GAP-like repeat-containing protein [Bacteroidetes bacterium]|nr:FG-GAP-like repeat-containing protein [Bacteroidota bacterium]